MKKTVVISSLIFFILAITGYQNPEPGRSYFNGEFNLGMIKKVKKIYIAFNDTIPNDTLYLCFKQDGLPVSIYRDIVSGVCLDGTCRRINLKIYWTITGRYLGFLLPGSQELTKKDHNLFTESDYKLLHSLLNDSLSVLAHFTLEEIHPGRTRGVNTDGITGATPPDVNAYIVPEAAYTTHTLWHLVYDEVPDSIVRKMAVCLNSNIMDSLLKSTCNFDRLWALNHFPKDLIAKKSIIEVVLEMLNEKESIVVKGSLNFLEKQELSDSVFQLNLFRLSQNSDFSTRNMALEQLKKVASLQSGVAGKLIECIPGVSIPTANAYIAILEQYIPTDDDLIKLCALLEHSDTKLSFNVYLYLVKNSVQKPWLIRKLKKFERRNFN